MRKKTLIFGIGLCLLITPLFLFLGLPGARANGSIPSEYSDMVDLNGEYIYNVTAFGGDTAWFNYDLNASEVWQMWSTEEGGQVIVNFTGFYNRHPNDTFGFMFLKFPDQNMPYMDISITDKVGTVNITRNNCSNGEIFNNMVLGHWPFDSGFLIPNNMTLMKELAVQTANESGLEYDIEESYSFVRFYFKDAFQETELLYNPQTGLLLEANVTAGGYHLEMFLTNFRTEFFDKTYQYDVSTFAGTLPIYYPNDSFAGYFFTSAGAFIEVNFTDLYSGVPHLDANATYLRYTPSYSSVLESVFYAENLSNSELSYKLLLGFDTFLPGFLIPDMNLSETKQNAIDAAEDDPGDDWDLYGELEILESDLTLKIKFDQTGGTQYTYLIIEKRTGLLLSADTGFGNYKLDMKIQGFSEPDYPETPSTPPPPNGNQIPGFPLILIGIVSVISVLGIGWKIKNNLHQ
ncbi:MAG: exported protein of unknown function [Promethearchaeota archaeon]|nr:MAG: exported protein of unknown function [Candidatus Lokiarchaeota archaeon]